MFLEGHPPLEARCACPELATAATVPRRYWFLPYIRQAASKVRRYSTTLARSPTTFALHPARRGPASQSCARARPPQAVVRFPTHPPSRVQVGRRRLLRLRGGAPAAHQRAAAAAAHTCTSGRRRCASSCRCAASSRRCCAASAPGVSHRAAPGLPGPSTPLPRAHVGR